MRRREFIALLAGTGAAAAWPFVARAVRIARVGFLGLTSASQQVARIDAFRGGLRDLGYVEGKNIQIEFRFANGDNDRLPGLVVELIGLNVDVIVAYATGVPSARRMTATIPIATLGTCFSIYFMYLQIAFIHAFCIYCLVSAVTTLLLFIAALSHFRATRAPTCRARLPIVSFDQNSHFESASSFRQGSSL